MLFRLTESIRSALYAIQAHGFRSFLTTLGITIGIASVIATVSLVQGFGQSLTDLFKGLGSNGITIVPHVSQKSKLQGHLAKLTMDDMLQIDHKIEGINSLTPMMQATQLFGGKITYDSNVVFSDIWGTTDSYQKMNDSYPTYGRFFNYSDEKTMRRVVVLGWKVYEKLELSKDVIGKYIQIGSEWFKVVGVMEEKGDVLGSSQDDFILMPFSTAYNLVGAAENPNIIIQLKITELEMMEEVIDEMQRMLRKLHKLKNDEDDDFKIYKASQLMSSIDDIADILTYILGGIVGISLLVGGVGIMNIMLVSVTERTKEIGICKALGAKRIDILLQFLFEGMMLSLLGGIIGLTLGYLLGHIVIIFVPTLSSAIVPLWAVLLSLGFSLLIGIIFGILPASKASSLLPIEALKYE